MWFVDPIADAHLATDDLCAAPKTNLAHSACALYVVTCQVEEHRLSSRLAILLM